MPDTTLHIRIKADYAASLIEHLQKEHAIEIVKGLNAGEQIVTGPFRALRDIKDGSKVREQKEEKKSEEKS